MNLQLATARLGVLLTAEALEAVRHLLQYTSSRGSTKAGKATPPSLPLQSMHSSLQASGPAGSEGIVMALGLNPRYVGAV